MISTPTPDPTPDQVGAGPYGSMMRARPTSWHYKGLEYVNERPVAAQQTGWHFVAVMRRHLPDAVGGVSWCTADGSNPALACTTPYN